MAIVDLISSRIFAFSTLIAIIVIVYLAVELTRRKKMTVNVRSLPAIEAIPEAVGRCAEMGKPLHQTFGYGGTGIVGDQAGQWLAGLSVLTYVAELCAKQDVPIIVTPSLAEVVPITTDIVRQAYENAGKPEAFKLDNIRYIPGEGPIQFAYVKGVLGYMAREKPAANVLIGPYYAESLMFVEQAATQGQITIGGTANTAQLPFFVVAADYTLIGEETYAAGAAISKDAVQLGSLRAQDVGRFFALALLVIGAVLVSVGIPWLVNVLNT